MYYTALLSGSGVAGVAAASPSLCISVMLVADVRKPLIDYSTRRHRTTPAQTNRCRIVKD